MWRQTVQPGGGWSFVTRLDDDDLKELKERFWLMFARYVVFAALAASQFVVAPSPVVARTTMSRGEIRQMPILERPGRPGHFYGNAVRRSATRKGAIPSS
jgi:hypothetical protein